MQLAQEHKGLEDLLGSIFKFFEQRTDLFHVMQSKTDKMGFPPGVAENMVLSQFKKYQEIYQKRTGNRMPDNLDDAISRQREVDKSTQRKIVEVDNTRTISSSSSSAPPVNTVNVGGSSISKASSATTASSNYSDNDVVLRTGTADAKTMKPVQLPDSNTSTHISTWNGAVTDEYRWSQSLQEATVEFVFPENMRPVNAKDLKVDIKNERLVIKHKSSDKPFFEGKFAERVHPEESVWNLEDKSKLILSLEKIRQTWWNAAFLGGPEIDATKVESTKKIEEYDGSTQGAIRKIMFDQNQKAQGLPTSDQLKTADLMKDAWNAENSPFKGTDFDPSLLNLTNNLPDHMHNM